MFHNNIVKISEKLNERSLLVENLLSNYLPYKFKHYLHSFLLRKKVKIFDFYLKPMATINFCACVLTTNGVALNNDKYLQIHCFCVKR